jgi:hypothetical protein
MRPGRRVITTIRSASELLVVDVEGDVRDGGNLSRALDEGLREVTDADADTARHLTT